MLGGKEKYIKKSDYVHTPIYVYTRGWCRTEEEREGVNALSGSVSHVQDEREGEEVNTIFFDIPLALTA